MPARGPLTISRDRHAGMDLLVPDIDASQRPPLEASRPSSRTRPPHSRRATTTLSGASGRSPGGRSRLIDAPAAAWLRHLGAEPDRLGERHVPCGPGRPAAGDLWPPGAPSLI